MRVMLLLLLSLVATALEAQTVSYFRVDEVGTGITTGPDGNLWFAAGETIVRMTPSGAMTSFPVARAGAAITTGPDGRIWYTIQNAPGAIGAITVTGTSTEYALPAGTTPRSITAGPDGNVWFGAMDGVGRITPAGVVTLFPFPEVTVPASEIRSITTGPDGNLWFADSRNNRVGRIAPAGTMTFFSTACCGGPISIARGNDGALWFARLNSNVLGRITTDGVVTSHPLPLPQTVNVVANGPDATIWFSTIRNSISQPARIGRIDLDGEVRTSDLTPLVIAVKALTAGPDGNMWAAVEPSGTGCTLDCPPPPTEPEIGIARVNVTGGAHLAAVPMLGEAMLGALALLLGGIAMLRMRL